LSLYGLNDISDVEAESATPGEYLKFNGEVWLNDTIDLGTDTNGSYIAALQAGTGISISPLFGESATPSISIGQSVATTANPSFAGLTADSIQIGITASNEIDTVSGNLIIDSAGGTVTVDDNLIVSGNLTINGTTTTVNTSTLNVSDNIITLNNDVTGTPTENAGIEVERGTSANVLLRWNETNDKWESTNDGTNYGNIVTTADSGLVTSNMIVDGTIVNADINASAAIALSKLASGSSAQVVLGNSTGVPTFTTVSGDVTIGNTGVTAIGSGVIVDADINASAAIAKTKISGTAITAADSGTVTETMLATGVARTGFRSTLNAQTGTSYTLVLTDLAKLITLDNTSAITLTIPLDSSVPFAIGDRIDILQKNTGMVTIVGTGGVTVNATPGLKLRSRWSSATLVKLDTNSWVAIGDMQA